MDDADLGSCEEKLIASHSSRISKLNLNHLQRLQNSLAGAITGTAKCEHDTPVLKTLHWLLIKKELNFGPVSSSIRRFIISSQHASAPCSLSKIASTQLGLLRLWLFTPYCRSSIRPPDWMSFNLLVLTEDTSIFYCVPSLVGTRKFGLTSGLSTENYQEHDFGLWFSL